MKITKEQTKTYLANTLKNALSYKGMIAIATVGIWILVLQNFGIIPISQSVYVENTVDVTGKVGVTGSVDVDNTVHVSGSVDVDNAVDVNLQYINGHSNCFYNNTQHPSQYFRIPVYNY